MGIAIGSSTTDTSTPSTADEVRSLDQQERTVEKQLEALEKETQVDAQLKAEEVVQLQAQLQMLANQIAELQSQAAGAAVPRVDAGSSAAHTAQSGPPFNQGTLDIVV